MLRNIVSNEIFTILFIVGLVFIACSKMLFPKRFNDFVLVLGNFRYLKIYSREQKFIDTFDSLLFANLLMNCSVFGYLVYDHLIVETQLSLTFLIKLFVGVGVFILSKILLERLIGSLFNIEGLINTYVFQKTSYKNFFGMVLLPINAMLLYSFTPTIWLLNLIIIIIVSINCVGLISSYKTYQNSIKPNIFYFILYLCTLEITPYMVIYKFIISA